MSSSVSMPKKLIGPVLGTRGMVPIGSCKFVRKLLVGPRLSPRSGLPPHRGRLTPPARLSRALSDRAGLPHSGPSSRTSAPACACLAGCRRAKAWPSGVSTRTNRIVRIRHDGGWGGRRVGSQSTGWSRGSGVER